VSPDDRAESQTPKEAEEAEDHGVGGSVDRAGAEADGLDALGVGLSGFTDGEAANEPDDEIDLGALAAVAGRSTAPARVADGDARVRVAGLSSIERHSAKLATTTPAPARVAAVAAPVSRPAPPRVSHVDTSADEPLELPRSRAPWVMPLIAGLGLGVGLAGVLFGMAANRPAAPAAPLAVAPAVPAASSAVPPALPQAPAGMPAPADTPSPTPRAAPTQPAPAPASRAASDAPPRRPVGSATSVREVAAPPEPARPTPPTPPSQGTVLSLRPVAEPAAVPAKTGLDSALDAADQQNAKAPASRSSVDSLLDEALAAPAQRDPMRAQREAALAQDALPQSPSRDDVTKAMTVLLPAIRGCAMGQSGLATASIVVRADGRVAGVEVAGAPFSGTASGRCMEGVIRRAQFTHFKQPIFRIKFPFAIQ